MPIQGSQEVIGYQLGCVLVPDLTGAALEEGWLLRNASRPWFVRIQPAATGIAEDLNQSRRFGLSTPHVFIQSN